MILADSESFAEASKLAKRKIIELAYQAGKLGKGSHVGGSLSSIDFLLFVVLSGKFKIRPKGNDRLILSKGHAALALYTVLNMYETLPKEMLDAYPTYGSPLLGHPVRCPEFGIEISTGSLGMGISIAAGLAMSNKIRDFPAKTIVVVGDGELNEGSVYESLRFSGKEKLTNLIILVDQNGFQQTGSTSDIAGEHDYKGLFESLGFLTLRANGHDYTSINSAFEEIDKSGSANPKCILMQTLKGHGLPEQGTNKYHHVIVTESMKNSFFEN